MSFAVDMLDMLTSAYDRTDLSRLKRGELPKTNIGKLIALSGWGFDILKDQAEKVKLWDSLEQKQGRELDRYGKDFGVPRGGSSDEVYRIMIKVKSISLLASGNLDAVIQAAAALFNVGAADVMAEELFPAKIYLYIDEDKLDETHKNLAPIIVSLMGRIKSAGVGLTIFYKTYHSWEQILYSGIATMECVRVTYEPLEQEAG